MPGKTSILEYVKKNLENNGFDVYIINEVPTMLLNNGFNSKKCGRMEFLKLIANTEIFLSNVLENSIIDKSDKTIILYDKSPIDNLAFISQIELDKMLFELGTSYEEIINSFDLILHLETVAKKYPELYSNDNNINRTLDMNLAIERNDKLLKAYDKCNQRVVIDAYKNINKKIERVIDEIQKLVRIN